ncbi:MAG TPA: hypothetical protein VGT05_01110 [Patescibacteria group bacterium]|nr:hypothetical protein [Patescibacteria group bacterium]
MATQPREQQPTPPQAEVLVQPSTQTRTTRQPIRTVIVGNDREFFSPVDRFVPDAVKTEFVESDIDEADMDFMWQGDDKIVLLPRPVDPEFISDISTLFGFKNARLLVPREAEAGLSEDTIADQEVFQTLVDEIKGTPDV